MKIRVIASIVAAALIAVLPVTASAAEYLLIGDADKNGVIDAADSLAVLRAAVGLESVPSGCMELYDVDGDGSVTSQDSLDIMRKSVGLPVASRVGKSSSVPVPEKASAAAVSAYASYLSGRQSTLEDGRFQLGDINGDSVPELLVSESFYHFATVTIVTYSNGRAVEVDNIGSFGACKYVPGGNLIEDGMSTAMVDEDTGGYYATYFKMNGTSLQKLLSFNTNSTAGGSRYVINDKKVSKQEYDKALSPYSSKNFVSAEYANGFALTSDNINKLKSSPRSFANPNDGRIKGIL